MHDQKDARALTQDLRDQLINAANVPQEAQHLPASGSADPGQAVHHALHLDQLPITPP
jgi:general secretion pathway protein D